MKEEEKVRFLTRELKAHGYQIEGHLGTGATAEVLLVAEQETGKRFACKTGTRREWLLPEAELLAGLRHPIFPDFYQCWEREGRVFVVMEYLAGQNLQELLEAGKEFDEEEWFRIALELAGGLAYLHDLMPPVVYCDLKPENILLDEEGSPRLVDLGAAAAPKGWLIGTPGYAAPEQCTCHPGPAADIYAMGMVLKELAGGQRMSRNRRRLLEHCTRTLPQERIPGMHELIRELSALRQRSRKGWLAGRWPGRSKKAVFYEKNLWLSQYKMQV